jgi:7-cyano-7-deazaguanine reductase
MTEPSPPFHALGNKGDSAFQGIETFPAPPNLERVQMTSDEVTAVCPVTGQPDFYTVEIDYQPRGRCIESKSLKLYFQTYRNEGLFCEDFANRILQDVNAAIEPAACAVTVVQKPRGGIAIRATASLPSL